MTGIRRVILRWCEVHLVLLLAVVAPRIVVSRLTGTTGLVALAGARDLLSIRFTQNLMLVHRIFTRKLDIEFVVAADLDEVVVLLLLGVFVGVLLVGVDCAHFVVVVSLTVVTFVCSLILQAVVYSHTLLQLLSCTSIVAKRRNLARICLVLHLLLLERRHGKCRPIRRINRIRLRLHDLLLALLATALLIATLQIGKCHDVLLVFAQW